MTATDEMVEAAADDAIRSLAISQRLLGTEEIVLVHQSDWGMLTVTGDAFGLQIQKETGVLREVR